MLKNTIMAAGIVAASFTATSASAAITLFFDESSTSSNTPMTGASAEVTMSFSDTAGGDVLLTVDVTNTTGDVLFGDMATSSKLTAFAFDLFPEGDVAYIVGSFIQGLHLDTLTVDNSLSPFGSFDISAGDDANNEGGNANSALPEGGTDTFSLELASTLLAVDLEAAFLLGLQGADTSAVRFMQVEGGYNQGASDKLTNPCIDGIGDCGDGGTGGEVPLPAAGWMMLAGVGGLAMTRRRRKAA